MKKINVVFVMTQLKQGGVERVVTTLLNRYPKNNHNLTLLLFNKEGEYLKQLPKGLKIVELKKNKNFSFASLIYKLSKYLIHNKPDVLISFLYYTNIITIVSHFISKSKATCILSERNDPRLYLDDVKYSIIKTLLMKLTYPKADSYIAISQGVKEGLIEKLKLEERKIEVIYNPTDIKYLQEKASCEVPSHINICNNNFNICISGRLSKQKNHTMLISSIHNINKELRKNIRIYVLGIGPLEKDIKSKVFDLGLSDNFIFCGYLTNPFSITSKCQLSVLTSLYEGFGNVITESLAVGTPVISTNCKSGPSEIIIDNFNGYLVNVNDHIQLSDKILFLMSNKSVLQNLSDNCVESINKFEVSLILNQYINHIDNIDKNKNISTKL